MAIVLKTKASIAAKRAANNARIEAANARAGKTQGQQVAADKSARASMRVVRERVAAQKAAPVAAASVPKVAPVAAVAAPKPVVRQTARRAAPKKAVVAPISSVAPAPAQNMSSEIMSREVPNRKMVDNVYGMKKTTPVRKSSWNWSV